MVIDGITKAENKNQEVQLDLGGKVLRAIRASAESEAQSLSLPLPKSILSLERSACVR